MVESLIAEKSIVDIIYHNENMWEFWQVEFWVGVKFLYLLLNRFWEVMLILHDE